MGGIHGEYPLVMTNSSPWYRWPIEIDGLPSNSMVIFHGYVTNNKMVNWQFPWECHRLRTYEQWE